MLRGPVFTVGGRKREEDRRLENEEWETERRGTVRTT